MRARGKPRRTGQLLWPRPGPLALGDRVTLRYRARRSWTRDDERRDVSAVLRCVETLPSGSATTAASLTCPTRVVSTHPWFEVEIDLEIALGGMPTMNAAGHRVHWTLTVLDDAEADGGQGVVVEVIVAPVVAAGVLDGGAVR